MRLLDYLREQITDMFTENPYRFFTEHDIHTALALIANDYLEGNEAILARTKDGRMVSRVHHEYPTPFRCDMNGSNFTVISEEEFSRKQENQRRLRARRGYIDLAVLDPSYVGSNSYIVVSGKRYASLLSSLRNQRFPALDLAVEVVYHPSLDGKIHEGIMRRRVESTIQDYKKLAAIMGFSFNGNQFCKEAAMFFFSNTKYVDKLDDMFREFPISSKVQIDKITAT